MRNKIKYSNSGITLISLIVTVIILLILAAVSISTLTGENGVITKAEEAAQKYSDAQQKEIELLDEMSNLIDYMENKSYLELWTGKLVGENGSLTLPISLNDCSKEYVLSVQSSLYKGEILLKVYGFSGSYVAYAAVDDSKSYSAELRQLFTIVEADSTLLETIEGTLISYSGNNTTCTLTYDAEALGSELTITKIASIEKTYTGFAKILFNGFNRYIDFLEEVDNGKFEGMTEEQIKAETNNLNFILSFASSDDLMDCVKYCINNGVSGYKYINGLTGSGVDEIYKVNETLELQTLRNILSYRASDVETIKLTIIQQIQCMMAFESITLNKVYSSVGSMNDPFTYMDFWEENKYLNEAYTRLIGNTWIPFTLLFADDIITYLNEDGKLEGDLATATETSFEINDETEIYAFTIPSTGNAGIAKRVVADFYDSAYDIIETADPDTLSELDKLKLEETLQFFIGPDSSSNTSFLYACLIGWCGAYEIYVDKSMDTMYTMMYDNNIRINMAGLRLGWNYVIQPTLMTELFHADEIAMLDLLDIRKDTEYLQKAGATAIAEDLYAYIESVIIEQPEEDTSTDTNTTTNTTDTNTVTDTNTTSTDTNTASADTNTASTDTNTASTDTNTTT